MVKLFPQDHSIRRFIDYYWVIDRSHPLAGEETVMYDFPSLAPELVLGLKGSISYTYKGVDYRVTESSLFTCLEEGVSVRLGRVVGMIVVRFKPVGLAAFTPFTSANAEHLIRQACIPARQILPDVIAGSDGFDSDTAPENLVEQLDSCFKKLLINRGSKLLLDLCEAIEPDMSVNELSQLSGSSYSTLERHFKRNTGLSPKQFLMRNRFRHVIDEINEGSSNDWFDLVVKYGYHDQNHFIKEVRRFSGFTPLALSQLPRLRTYGPETVGEFLL